MQRRQSHCLREMHSQGRGNGKLQNFLQRGPERLLSILLPGSCRPAATIKARDKNKNQ